MSRIFFHVDVNSAFLSWEAVDRLRKGETLDLRNIPSAVGGNPEKRHGVILAKSIPAKKYGIKTGEPVVAALKKCPDLYLVPPQHDFYEKCSYELISFLETKSPCVEKFSIDECFMEMTGMEYLLGEPVKAAYKLKEEIKEKFGFTVNIGVSENKLLSKMASDFEKPDKVHTLFLNEIEEKLWPQDASDLFGVGESTFNKLKSIGIKTIGDIAKTDVSILEYHLKSQGRTIWNYANGKSFGESDRSGGKSIGNSTTVPVDIKDRETAYKYLLELCESVGTRLRSTGLKAHTVCVNFKNNKFITYSIQKKIHQGIESTSDIYKYAVELFNKGWKRDPLRLIGVTVSSLSKEKNVQLSILEDPKEYIKSSKLDCSIDVLREKYGKDILKRAVLLENKNEKQ